MENISYDAEVANCDMTSIRESIKQALESSYLDPSEAQNIMNSLETDISACTQQRREESNTLLESLLIQGVRTTTLTDDRTQSYLGFSAASIREELTQQGITFPTEYSIRKDGEVFYFHDTEGNAFAQYDRSSGEAGEVSGIDSWQKDDTSDNIDFSTIPDAQNIADSSVLVMESNLISKGEEVIREQFEAVGNMEISVDSIIDDPNILDMLCIATGRERGAIKDSFGEIYTQMSQEGVALGGRDLIRVEKKGTLLEMSVASNGKTYSQIL